MRYRVEVRASAGPWEVIATADTPREARRIGRRRQGWSDYSITPVSE